MDRVIVTIQENCFGNCYDLELPVSPEIEFLTYDIIQTLEGYIPELKIKSNHVFFICDRTGKVLDKNKNLTEEKIRNGDILRMAQDE